MKTQDFLSSAGRHPLLSFNRDYGIASAAAVLGLFLAIGGAAHGQGTVLFNNFTSRRAPIFSPQLSTPGLQLTGQPASATPGNATPLGSTVYTGTPLSG